MKKGALACFALVLAIAATISGSCGCDDTSYVEDSHEIRQVWDLSGTFVAFEGYNWDGLAEGATWNYSINIEEAKDGELSIGSIHFRTEDGVEVAGQVEATTRDYAYWHQWGVTESLAAVGKAEHRDATYSFMLLYAEKAVHLMISDVSYDPYWSAQEVWPNSLRRYEVVSQPTGGFPFGDDDGTSEITDSQEIRQVWDLSGRFTALEGYDWGGLAEGATWSYRINIEEATDGDHSVGTVHFWTADGIEVVGQVEDTARDYAYWQQWGATRSLAAVGKAEYGDATYNFMLLYAERGVHFMISDVSHNPYWSTQKVWPNYLRRYELSSEVTWDFPFEDGDSTSGVTDSQEIRQVWELSGTFVAWKDYDWGGLAEGATWSYSVNIEEAKDGDHSVGSVRFWTADGIEVVGQVEATARDYAYWLQWGDSNLTAAGNAEYNDKLYYFMLLYAEKGVHFAISDLPYDSYWVSQTIWPRSLRLYELHSLNTHDFPFQFDNQVQSELEHSHEIRQVWDLSGTFIALEDYGYDWGGLAEGATWNYSIYIEEAMEEDLSVGSIRFWTEDGVEVIGQVEATARNYPYNQSWSGENLAVAGRAEYAKARFYFILLYSERAVWFAISDLPYEPYWADYSAWPPHLREYQLHSLNSYDFPFQFDDQV